MSTIAEAKQALPLPLLMQRLGLNAHAKKIARCPFHEDRHSSFSVWSNNASGWRWKCHAGCGEGDEVTLIEKQRGVANGEAIKIYLEMSGLNRLKPVAPIDWRACVEGFTEQHIKKLAKWRGLSLEFCTWLKANQLVGVIDGCIAFPVYDDSGRVVAAHYRLKDGRWNYKPQGCRMQPLVFGELTAGDPVHLFESQWDALTFADQSGERSGIIVTRGASNGRAGAKLIPEGSIVYLWPQNDKPSDKWQQDICASATATVKRVQIPIVYKDLNDWTRNGGTAVSLLAAMNAATTLREAERQRPLIEFKSPLQLQAFAPPANLVLLGDCHIVRGSVFVIGGAPGVGKSRASVALAEAGATGHEWFGLRVHRRFKTMIIQTENGPFRLSKEFAELDCEALDAYVRICEPPPFGLCLDREDFREQLSASVRSFGPDVVVLDPWNAAALDEKAREYLETFQTIRSLLPTCDDAPAIGIVAHTRKPKSDERATGRGLLNLLAGSYVLGSVPRTVFVMQAASDDTVDNRVVWTCCKNNDGELGKRSAWERRNGLFAAVTDFDWDELDSPPRDSRVLIMRDDVAAIFENGEKQLSRGDAVRLLEKSTNAKHSACYNALKLNGRFADHLAEAGGLLLWRP